jgi:hypothetical protein
MTSKPQVAKPAQRNFQWGIASTDIRFMQAPELDGARDGSNCQDCSAISPLPRPKRAPADPAQGPK